MRNKKVPGNACGKKGPLLEQAVTQPSNYLGASLFDVAIVAQLVHYATILMHPVGLVPRP